jgi:hypothetical protein
MIGLEAPRSTPLRTGSRPEPYRLVPCTQPTTRSRLSVVHKGQSLPCFACSPQEQVERRSRRHTYVLVYESLMAVVYNDDTPMVAPHNLRLFCPSLLKEAFDDRCGTLVSPEIELNLQDLVAAPFQYSDWRETSACV